MDCHPLIIGPHGLPDWEVRGSWFKMEIGALRRCSPPNGLPPTHHRAPWLCSKTRLDAQVQLQAKLTRRAHHCTTQVSMNNNPWADFYAMALVQVKHLPLGLLA